MRKYLLLLAVLLAVVSSSAQQLIVHRTTGENVVFVLSDEPVTTFDGDQLVITTSKEQVMYPLADIEKFTYANTQDNTGLDEQTSVIVRVDSEGALIEGLRENVAVELYSIDGQRLASVTAKASQPTFLPLTAYSAGMYIITAGGFSYKFVKK